MHEGSCVMVVADGSVVTIRETSADGLIDYQISNIRHEYGNGRARFTIKDICQFRPRKGVRLRSGRVFREKYRTMFFKDP